MHWSWCVQLQHNIWVYYDISFSFTTTITSLAEQTELSARYSLLPTIISDDCSVAHYKRTTLKNKTLYYSTYLIFCSLVVSERNAVCIFLQRSLYARTADAYFVKSNIIALAGGTYSIQVQFSTIEEECFCLYCLLQTPLLYFYVYVFYNVIEQRCFCSAPIKRTCHRDKAIEKKIAPKLKIFKGISFKQRVE